MEQIHPDEMVPNTQYIVDDPRSVALAKLLNMKIYKTVTFIRVAYRWNGVWYYLFHLDGRKRYFTSNDTFYK